MSRSAAVMRLCPSREPGLFAERSPARPTTPESCYGRRELLKDHYATGRPNAFARASTAGAQAAKAAAATERNQAGYLRAGNQNQAEAVKREAKLPALKKTTRPRPAPSLQSKKADANYKLGGGRGLRLGSALLDERRKNFR